MEAYPLQWPLGWQRTVSPKRSRFGTYNSKPTIYSATTKIINEIRMLTKTKDDIVISTNLKLKNDGLPYSNQKEPADQGVAVYFKMNGESMVIACDSFDKIGCNLYACALTIQAMMGIDRWGCSELLKRAFTGFKALPEKTNKKSCWEVLGIERTIDSPTIRRAYAAKVKVVHPDNKDTGNNESFLELQQAYMEALNSK